MSCLISRVPCEGDPMQVACQGDMLKVTTKHVEVVTIGIACTGPSAGMPHTMLMAAPAAPPAERQELTRYHVSPYSTFPTPDVGQPKRQCVSQCAMAPDSGLPATWSPAE